MTSKLNKKIFDIESQLETAHFEVTKYPSPSHELTVVKHFLKVVLIKLRDSDEYEAAVNEILEKGGKLVDADFPEVEELVDADFPEVEEEEDD